VIGLSFVQQQALGVQSPPAITRVKDSQTSGVVRTVRVSPS
jgi:hypothetical protein